MGNFQVMQLRRVGRCPGPPHLCCLLSVQLSRDYWREAAPGVTLHKVHDCVYALSDQNDAKNPHTASRCVENLGLLGFARKSEGEAPCVLCPVSECALCCLQASIYLVATVEGFIDQSIGWCGDQVQDCR